MLRSAVALFAALLPRRRPLPRDRAERATAHHLEEAGWEILAVNLRIGSDEADLYCLDDSGRPVLVEVKSSAGDLRGPEEAVDRRKQAALRRIALALSRDPRSRGRVPRIDVITVRLTNTEARIERHLEDAVGEGPLRVRGRGELR